MRRSPLMQSLVPPNKFRFCFVVSQRSSEKSLVVFQNLVYKIPHCKQNYSYQGEALNIPTAF